MNEWNGDTGTLFEWVGLVCLRSQRSVYICLYLSHIWQQISLNPGSPWTIVWNLSLRSTITTTTTLHQLRPPTTITTTATSAHHPRMAMSAHHHHHSNDIGWWTPDDHTAPIQDNMQWAYSWADAGLDSIASRMRWMRLAASGGDGCRGSLSCCRGWAQVSKNPSPHHSLLWQMTMTDVHWLQRTTTTRDEGRAQSKDPDNGRPRLRPRLLPRTTTYHHDARATATDDNAPPTVTTIDARQRRWMTMTHIRQWWPRPDEPTYILVDTVLHPFYHLFACASCGKIARLFCKFHSICLHLCINAI